MALLSKSGIVTIAVATGLVLTAGTSGAVAGAMITGKQIKNSTVTTKDIKNDNLTGADVADGSLAGADVADGSLAAGDLSATGRAELLGARASGVVRRNGTVDHYRGPAGTSAVVSNPSPGFFCVTLQGFSSAVNATNAVLVATPNYADDGTSVSTEGTSNVEVYAAPAVGCENGFQLYTFQRAQGTGDLAFTDQGFTFLVN